MVQLFVVNHRMSVQDPSKPEEVVEVFDVVQNDKGTQLRWVESISDPSLFVGKSYFHLSHDLFRTHGGPTLLYGAALPLG